MNNIIGATVFCFFLILILFTLLIFGIAKAKKECCLKKIFSNHQKENCLYLNRIKLLNVFISFLLALLIVFGFLVFAAKFSIFWENKIFKILFIVFGINTFFSLLFVNLRCLLFIFKKKKEKK